MRQGAHEKKPIALMPPSVAKGFGRNDVMVTEATMQRPTCSPPIFGTIPMSMRAERRWCCWRYEWKSKENKWAKVPIDKIGKWMKWSSQDNWLTFDEAVAAYRRHKTSGIGFFLGDGWAGIDFDDHFDPITKLPDAFAKSVLSRLNSRSDISPSGEGVKVIVRATIPRGHIDHEAGIEIYGQGRFFTVTGHRLNDYPADVADRQNELTALLGELSPQPEKKPKPKTTSQTGGQSDRDTAIAATQVLNDARCDGYADWLKVGQALHSIDSSLLGEWDSWSQRSNKYVPGACESKWTSFNGDGGVGIGSLCLWADQDSPGWREQYRANGATHKKTTRKTTTTDNDSADNTPNEAPDDPHRLARLFIEQRGTSPTGDITLRFWRDEWSIWDGAAYRVTPPGELKAELAATIKQEFDRLNLEELKRPREDDEKPPTVRKVTTGLLANAMTALSSVCILSATIRQPSWLTEEELFPASEVLATQTGLIHIPSLVAGKPSTLPPTPQFFSAGCVDYGFDAEAECPMWQAFLQSLWPDDLQSVEALQEWFGYLLLPDTRQHKLLTLIGPPRSGKGTIARVLKGVIGERSLASPTLSSLAGPFGLWPLNGKTVALIPEARLGRNADAIAVVERLLSISGEDPQDVHRKNLPTITGVKLATRFVLMTNELPNLRDSSGAFSNRVVLLRTTQSWLGKEDTKLGSRLQHELPGILNWSIEGWQRLQERGHFLQPDSGRELLADLTDLASPVSQFIRERCAVGPEFSCDIDDLFASWRNWCEEHGREHAGTQQTFGRDLRAKLPGLAVTQPRTDSGGRIRSYNGIGLRSGTPWHAVHTYARDAQESDVTSCS